MINLLSVLTYIKNIGLVGIIISLVVFYIVRFFLKLYNYPPGPLPLPLIGNILSFRYYKRHWAEEILQYKDAYGPVFTLWIGCMPFVIICDLDMAREAFGKSEFSGRPALLIGTIFCTNERKDVCFNDYNKSWISLRKESYIILRKYAKSQELSKVVADNVRQFIDNVTSMEGIGKPFKPNLYVYHLIVSTMGSLMFSKKIKINKPNKLLKCKYLTTDFGDELGSSMFIYGFIPIAQYFMANPLAKYQSIFDEMWIYARDLYESHVKTYDSNNLRDFCDTIIAAKYEAIADNKPSAKYLTDENLITTMCGLINAGVETTQDTVLWILLYIAYYPDYQQKLRNEISREIGDRVPVFEDKSRLNYTLAFMTEILRHRNPAPIGNFHRTVVDTHLGKHLLPKHTQVLLHQGFIMTDPTKWINSDKFEPERFLDKHGLFIETKAAEYIPFGVGRRLCPGDTLVHSEVFFVLVNIMQMTSQYRIELHSNNGLDPDVGSYFICNPRPYEIVLTAK